ncbi:hypothetical protein BGW39_006529 [Mortierella sp. 14UC]|nr:hypothetical protein BGW39_006529 [Mortierella sp. 14UC]
MAAHLLEKVNVSIHQPFGIKLDDYFGKGYELVTGKPIDSFVFQEEVTPLSTQYEVSMWTTMYFIVIFGGRQIMKNQDTFKLKSLFILHNFLSTVASGALLVLFIENLRLELLYYLNYLVQYWELADTVFQVLKKPLRPSCVFRWASWAKGANGLLSSCLLLFINFYRLTYNAKAKAAK